MIAIRVQITIANRVRLLPAGDCAWIRPAGGDPVAV